MSKFKTMIRKDIETCDMYISKDFAKYSEVQALLGKYLIDYEDFDKGIISYASFPGCETNEIENIKIIKNKLEYLLSRTDNPDLYNKSKSSLVNVSTINNNENNNNNVNINMTIEEIRKNIEDNTYLGVKEKFELIEKLDEIEKLQKSEETKSKKWDKAKSIFTFLLDKGADIAIIYIPQILKALNT